MDWNSPVWNRTVSSYFLVIVDVLRNKLIQEQRVTGNLNQYTFTDLPDNTAMAVDLTAETVTSRGLTSNAVSFVTMKAPPPPIFTCSHDSVTTGIFQDVNVTEDGTKVAIWETGFTKKPGTEQSIKLTGNGDLQIDTPNSVTIGSLQVLGASLVLQDNVTMFITSFLDKCFADTASAPQNLTISDPIWVSSPYQYYKATVEWLIPTSAGGSEVDHYVLKVSGRDSYIVNSTNSKQSSKNITFGPLFKFYPNTIYFFSVAANSQFGQGAFSEPVKYTAPPAVADCGLRAVFKSDVDLVEWGEQSKNGDLQLDFGDWYNWQDTKPDNRNGAQISPSVKGIKRLSILVNSVSLLFFFL